MSDTRRRRHLGALLGAAVLVGAFGAPGAAAAAKIRRRHPGEGHRRPSPTQPAPSPARRHATHGLVPGRVTAIGDSVMIDYAPDLERDLRHVVVDATVGEQWDTGVAVAEELRARDQLGTEVIIGLGTNGPITMAQFDAMRHALAGVERIVFVTVHVDRPWQQEVNAVLAAGVRATPDARLANWYQLSAPHPSWFYADGTHLPIGGVGAQALAALVARTLEAPPRPAPRH